MLGLHHLPGLRDVAGGRAVELLARCAGTRVGVMPCALQGEHQPPAAECAHEGLQGLQVGGRCPAL